MTKDHILNSLVKETIEGINSSESTFDTYLIIKTQLDRALDIGNNYLKFINPKNRKVQKIDDYGKVLGTFNSEREAHRMTKISRSSIKRVLKGEQHKAGGYIFKYE